MATKSYLTAIARTGASVPARHSVRLMRTNETVLDWGCGRGRDVEYFKAQGLRAHGYDPHYCPELTYWPFENITCSYVLNVLEEDARHQCLEDMLQYAMTGRTRVFVAARGRGELEKQVKHTWSRHEDGWVTPRGTFQAGFDFRKLSRLLAEHGVPVDDTLIENNSTIMVTGLYRGAR